MVFQQPGLKTTVDRGIFTASSWSYRAHKAFAVPSYGILMLFSLYQGKCSWKIWVSGHCGG